MPSSDPVQLRYCPLCHQLIKPSLFHTQEAEVREDGCYHAACLAKRDSVAAHAPAGDGAHGRGHNAAPGGHVHHGAITENAGTPARRKTTASVTATLPVARAEPPSKARHSGAAHHSHRTPVQKGSSLGILLGVGGLLLLVGGGIALYLLQHGPESPAVPGEQPMAGKPTTPVKPASGATGEPAHPALPANPAVPAVPPPPELTPYELAKLRKKQEPATTTPTTSTRPTTPTPADNGYEPAGPTVAWFDGTSLAGWTVGGPRHEAFQIQDGAIEIDPGGDSAFLTHPVGADHFDLTFEFREGPTDLGAYAELWTPVGKINLEAGQFQSSAWTPVRISVRGGKMVATNGTKGSNDMLPSIMSQNIPPADLAARTQDGKVISFMFSRVDTKSLRNVQFTPWRPKAATVPPATPPPAPPVEAGTLLPLPLALKTDKLEQPQGLWQRAEIKTENGKSFVVWSARIRKTLTLDFAFNLPNRMLPPRLHLNAEYRLRNTSARQISIKLWGPGGPIVDERLQAPAVDRWQTLDIDFNDCKNSVDQIEIRIAEDAGEDACLDIAGVTLSVPAP